MTDTPVDTADIANAAVPAVGRQELGGPRRLRRGAFVPAIEAKAGAEGDGSAAARRDPGRSAPHRRLPSSTARSRSTASAAPPTAPPTAIDITNPAAGPAPSGGGNIRCRRIVVSPGGQIAACDPRPRRQETAVRAEHAVAGAPRKAASS